ncbi:MAG: sel1 repeat family protein, partial [Candidatus Methanomethylophilaceae archaeon]|nr:sel1 repeat family protein [Candidatus Methanomethylophilaceae archaeon]
CMDGNVPSVKGCVFGINPVFISEGEKESLLSYKADWIVLDSVNMSLNVDSLEDVKDDLESLSKFLKKNWARKIILICARPSAYRQEGQAIVPVTRNSPSVSDAICSAIMERVNCYLITIPSDCVSRSGKPFDYTEETTRFIRSVIDVIAVKYDRSVVERLEIEYCKGMESMIARSADSIKTKRKAFRSAVKSKKSVEACLICGDLVSMGDMWASSLAEESYKVASKECDDPAVLAECLRKFSNAGMPWAKYALFDILWKDGNSTSDKEMIDVIAPLVEEGDGIAMKRMGRAYRHGKGVEADLDKALEMMKAAHKLRTRGTSVELFDIYWAIGTPEAYKSMIPIVKPLADKGNVPAMVRMARAYRDGKGVKKNLDESMRLYDKAVAANPAISKERDVLKKKMALSKK